MLQWANAGLDYLKPGESVMSKYARDFRRLLRLSIASLSIASVNGLVSQAEAQQVSTNYADAIVLPKYYPGMGRIMVIGGIESARPVTNKTISHTQVASPVLSGGENRFTVQANVTLDQPNQVNVIVQPVAVATVIATPEPVGSPQIVTPAPALAPQLATPAPAVVPKLIAPPSTPPQPLQIQSNSLVQPAVVEPSQESELQRRPAERDTNVPQPREVREVQPQRIQPQLRREQPRDFQGVPLKQDRNQPNRDQPNLDQPNRDQPNRDENQVREQPLRDNETNRDEARGPDRNQAPMVRRSEFSGRGGNPGGMAGQGPWMRGGMDSGPNGSGPNNRPNNGPNNGGPNNRPNNGPNNGPGPWPSNGPGQDLDSMDRIFNSPAVRQYLQLKEENLQLKAELKMKERELDMKMEMTEMRLRMHMQEAEKRVDQANHELAEMKERAGREQTSVQERRPAQGAARPQGPQQLLLELQMSEQEAASKLGEQHPRVVELRKRIAAVREQPETEQRPREAAERAAGKEREELQKNVERVTQERNRVVAELENVLKQSADMKRKLEAVAQEKANLEKSLQEAKRSAEMQFQKAQQAADQAARAEIEAAARQKQIELEEAEIADAKKAAAKKSENKKEEAAKKEEAKKEKPANRKKHKDDKGDEGDDEGNK